MRNRRWLNHGCARDLCGTVILCGRKWKLHAGPVNNLVGSSTAPNCKGRLWVRRPHARHLPATASRELVDAPASSGIARRTSNVHLTRQACHRNIPAINETCKKTYHVLFPNLKISKYWSLCAIGLVWKLCLTVNGSTSDQLDFANWFASV